MRWTPTTEFWGPILEPSYLPYLYFSSQVPLDASSHSSEVKLLRKLFTAIKTSYFLFFGRGEKTPAWTNMARYQRHHQGLLSRTACLNMCMNPRTEPVERRMVHWNIFSYKTNEKKKKIARYLVNNQFVFSSVKPVINCWRARGRCLQSIWGLRPGEPRLAAFRLLTGKAWKGERTTLDHSDEDKKTNKQKTSTTLHDTNSLGLFLFACFHKMFSLSHARSEPDCYCSWE